jgi:hypothetical protein
VANKRTRKLTEGTAEAVALTEASGGVTPLAHLLAVLRDPNSSPSRKDAAAQAACPYIHPKLSMTASASIGANAGSSTTTTNFTILSIARGGRYCEETGQITFDDGTLATPEDTRFRPYEPTVLLELQSAPTTVEPPERLPVLESEDDDKVERLDRWRRRDETP